MEATTDVILAQVKCFEHHMTKWLLRIANDGEGWERSRVKEYYRTCRDCGIYQVSPLKEVA